MKQFQSIEKLETGILYALELASQGEKRAGQTYRLKGRTGREYLPVFFFRKLCRIGH